VTPTTTEYPPLTPHEYLVRERRAEYRSEYVGGEVRAMSGASRAHGRIVFKLATALGNQLGGRPCEAYVADMRVRVPSTGAYLYPDLVVACGEPAFEDGELDTLVNPSVIVEVLSPSTERFDRGAKWDLYRRNPSLQQYVLLRQDARRAEWYVRQPGGLWLFEMAEGPGAALPLESIGCTLALDEVYEGVLP
jgi:Uma2 family endonuclease